jgi:hypothetical protein
MGQDYRTLQDAPSADGTDANSVEAQNAAAIKSTFAPKVTYNPLVETARSAGQGATFGLLDELEAALRTGSISNEEYTKLRDQLRGQQKQFGEDFPAVKTPVELAGGFAVPIGIVGKTVQTLAPEARSLITGGEGLGGQVLRTTAAGMTTGALSGYGYAEKDAGTEAAKGAIFGGVLGGTVPIVIDKAGTIIKNVLNSAGIGDQATAASKMLASYMQKDNLTPQEAQQALDELKRLGVPNPVIADLGANLKNLAYNAYIVQSKAKGATENFLESRLIDQPNNIVKGLVEKAGLAKDVNGYEYLNALAESQALKASAAYPKAYSLAIDARPFRTYIDRPVFVEAYKEAQKRAAVKGETLPDLDAIRNAQSVPTDILHKIKIGLDGLIEKETDAVTTKVTGYGRDLINVKNEFNDKIKALNNDYKLANAEFADASRIRSSFEMGQKYQSLDTKEAIANIKKMNSDEKEAFRLGMMADINKRVDRFKSGDFTREVFKSNNQKLLIRNAFTDTVDANGKVIKSAQDAYTDFSQYIKGLEQQSKTAKKVIGGSPSGERISSTDQARELAGMAESAATGNVFGLMKAAGSSLLARAKGISSESSELLQQKLFNADPIEQRAILAELNRRAKMPKTGLLSGAAGVGTATGIIGD